MTDASHGNQSAIDQMHKWLAGWIPASAELCTPTHKGTYVRWRIDFEDGVTARVSFPIAELEQGQADFRRKIEGDGLLQGGGGNYRMERGRLGVELIPNPPEFNGVVP